jgi:hypothetical protein
MPAKKVEESKQPYFSAASIICLVAGLPLARLSADMIGPKDDYTGYGGLGTAIATLMLRLPVCPECCGGCIQYLLPGKSGKQRGQVLPLNCNGTNDIRH